MKKGRQGREGGKAREKYQPKSNTEHGSSLRVSSGDKGVIGSLMMGCLWATYIPRLFGSLNVQVGLGNLAQVSNKKKQIPAILGNESTLKICVQRNSKVL